MSQKLNYIKWGFESRLKLITFKKVTTLNYIKWGFESRLKLLLLLIQEIKIISNGDLRVD